MATVNIVEQYKVDLNAPSTPQTVATLVNTPQTNDLVLVVASALFDNSVGASALSGLGATWTRHNQFDNAGGTSAHTGAVTPMYLGRGASAAGAISMAHSSFRGTVWVFLLRADDGSYISAIEDGTKFTSVTAASSRARTLHPGDKVFAQFSVAQGSGTPSLTASAAFDATPTGKDDVFVETALGYRTATADESFTASLGSSSARTGVLSTIHVSANPQPEKRVWGLMTRVSSGSSAAVVIPVSASEFLANDIVMVAIQFQQLAGGSQYPVTVTGLGATWTLDRSGETLTSGDPCLIMAYGRGATAPGDVTVTPGGNLYGAVVVAVVRGLATTVLGGQTNDRTSSTAMTFTSSDLQADDGEIVFDAAMFMGSSVNGVFPNPPVPASDWVALDGWGNSYLQGRIAYRFNTADDEIHNVTVTTNIARHIRIGQYRLGEVVAGQSGALSRVTEIDSAGLLRNGDPGTLYEDSPFPGVNYQESNWFAESSGVTRTYDNGVIEWSWPYAFAAGFQLQTRRVGAIDTSVEQYVYAEWQFSAYEPGATPDMRMKTAAGSNRNAVLTEDLGDGWYRSWFDFSAGGINEPSGPYFEWSGIPMLAKVRVRRLATARTLGDYYAVFKIHRAVSLNEARTITGQQTPPAQNGPLDRVTEGDAAQDLTGSQTEDRSGPLDRVVETSIAGVLSYPQQGTLDRVTSEETAAPLGSPQQGVLDRVIETEEAQFLVPLVPAYLLVLTPQVGQPPTTVTAAMANLEPLVEVTFAIDGITVGTEVTDANGDILEIVLPVDRQFGAGVHELTGTTATRQGSATFTVLAAPNALPTIPAPDDPPVLVEPPVNDVYRWIFQDLMPGGLGSWVMPINPTTMSNPHVRKTLAQASTTAVRGAFHIGEGATPVEWEFAGFAPDQAFQDKLLAYAELPYRFYIIDHRGRAWTVAIASLDIKPRNRVLNDQGVPQDWLADYAVKVALFSQTPTVPVLP